MEYLDFCIADETHLSCPVNVDAIFYVFADERYQVRHLPIPHSMVLVATLSGQGQLRLEDQTFTLGAGDVLLFDAGHCPFSYGCTDTSWNFWWFEFRCADPELVSFPQCQPLSLPLNDMQLCLCDEALYRLKLKETTVASSLFTSMLCLLQKRSQEPQLESGSAALFRQADQYIRRHLSTATVQTTAHSLNISEHTLLNVFRQLLNIPTVEYIHRLKTDMARHLLLTTENSIKEIADTLGFADQFAFSKSFRKRFGLSPLQYKHRYQRAAAEPVQPGVMVHPLA